jgi:hypothetical protein
MHDDDWFSNPEALKIFVNTSRSHPGRQFFFSAYSNAFLDKNTRELFRITRRRLKTLEKNPKTLLSRNTIGPPSVTFHKQRPGILYDPALKWLVDIDFYIRFLKHTKPVMIPENLIMVGMSDEQVTRQVFRNPYVEIPENLYFLNRIGIPSLKNIRVYDAYWRFIRNLNIRSSVQIRETGYDKPVPRIIESMIHFQSSIPKAVLKSGICSKILMFVHYIFQYAKLDRV